MRRFSNVDCRHSLLYAKLKKSNQIKKPNNNKQTNIYINLLYYYYYNLIIIQQMNLYFKKLQLKFTHNEIMMTQLQPQQ